MDYMKAYQDWMFREVSAMSLNKLASPVRSENMTDLNSFRKMGDISVRHACHMLSQWTNAEFRNNRRVVVIFLQINLLRKIAIVEIKTENGHRLYR